MHRKMDAQIHVNIQIIQVLLKHFHYQIILLTLNKNINIENIGFYLIKIFNIFIAEYDQTFKLQITRKSRAFLRLLKSSKTVKFDVYYKR